MFSVIDCATDVSAFARDLKVAGVETVIRYYNHKNSRNLPHKRLEHEEADALMSEGLSLVPVFQERGGHGGRISDFDQESGKRDAERALALANRIGQPKSSAIYFAIDHDFYRPNELKPIGQYFSAVARLLDGKYRVGVYGSGAQASFLKREKLVDFVWLAAAKGWSGTRAMLETDQWALYQKWPPQFWGDGSFSYDGNVVSPAWKDFGQFGNSNPYEAARSGTSVIMEVTARRGLNLRRGPGTDYGVELTLSSGSIVHAIERNGNWINVDVQGDGLSDGFMHADFLRTISGAFLNEVEPSADILEPFDVARSELSTGVFEFPGRANNPRIVAYHESTRAYSGTADAVPWCSSFVNFCVERAGLVGTNSQRARSWEDWGYDVTDAPRVGDVVVFSRENSDVKGGHVGFYVGETDDTISLLGGNQSNKVKISNYPKNGKLGNFKYKLLSIRRGLSI